jgi:hypothetical protein
MTSGEERKSGEFFRTFFIGTVVGGVAVFVTGLLLFRVAPFSDFYRYVLTSGPAAGVVRESPVVWAVFLGSLAYGALVTLAIGSRAVDRTTSTRPGTAATPPPATVP